MRVARRDPARREASRKEGRRQRHSGRLNQPHLPLSLRALRLRPDAPRERGRSIAKVKRETARRMGEGGRPSTSPTRQAFAISPGYGIDHVAPASSAGRAKPLI